MGIPWIKNGKVDFNLIPKIKWKNAADAITIEQACKLIADRINEAEEEKEKAKARVQEYEEHINADVRVQQLQEKLSKLQEESRRDFRIYENESTAIGEWQNQHDLKIHKLNTLDAKLQAGGAIGGRYYYEFYPTSIGTACICVCGRCQRRALRESAGNYEEYVKLKKKYDAEFEFRELG